MPSLLLLLILLPPPSFAPLSAGATAGRQDADARARALVDQLSSDPPEVRRKAEDDLAAMGAAGVPAMLQSLAGSPGAARDKAAELLPRLASKDWKQRDEATRALGRLGSAVLPLLKARADDADLELRWRVLAAIAEIEERAPQDAGRALLRTESVCEILGRVADPRGVAPLLAIAEDREVSARVLSRAVEALARCRPLLDEAQADRAGDAAIRSIIAPDPRGAVIPVRAAGRIGSALAAPTLVSVLEEPLQTDLLLLREAMAALVRLGGAAGTRAVVKQLSADDPYLREGAQAALAERKVPLAGFDPRLPEAENAKAVDAARHWWSAAFKEPWKE